MNQPSSPSPSDVSSFAPPKWVSWLIALVPVFPPLYLAAFVSLKLLRTLPPTARYVLFFFTSTQLVAALFTPRPLLSLGLAAARTLFILAMISAGVYLRDSRNLRPLLWGQLVIFSTAWGYTLYTQGFAGVQARLGHPYYYIVSLGLVATVAMWIIMFWDGGRLWWRIPAGVFTTATFLAAGSRGPLLALIIGTIGALGLRSRGHVGLFLLGLATTAALFFGLGSSNIQIKPIQRLLSDQTSGREFIWRDAVVGWATSPIGGVGAYQGGNYLVSLLKDGCQLTPTLERNDIACSASVARWSSVWLIAHNAWLHWLLETGLIGLVGLIGIMGFSLLAIFRLKDPLLLAVALGYLAMNTIDVLIAVPSQHFSELWWAVVGLSLAPAQLRDQAQQKTSQHDTD